MKRFLLTLTVILTGYTTYAQVVCAGISPVSIQGNYDFNIQANCGLWPGQTDDGTWGAWTGGLDFNIPGDHIQGELMLVEDGTPGTNPQGNPISQEGCNALTNNLTGKIAVVYRNTCWFSSKVYYAQQAGAIGVIIVNREAGTIGMLGNTDIVNGPLGIDCTIPAIMLSDTDGAILIQEMNNGPVTMFIGNKVGAFQNDAGIVSSSTLIPKASGVPVQLASNASEFNFDLGTRIYNYGVNDQNNISLNATIDGPSGNVYNETAAGISIVSGDSVDVFPGAGFSLPQFGLASYPEGRYTLTYTVDIGTADDFSADNVRQVDFVIQDSIYTLANTDVTTNHPASNGGFRPSTNTSTFSQCIVFDDANGSRIAVEGLYFSATTGNDANGNPIDLSGEEIALYVYRWEDVFTDLNDANLAFNSLSPVGVGYYYYPSDLQGETVYGELDSPVTLEDAQRFLMCAQTVNLDLFLGFDNSRNYLWNEAYYLQPLGPIESDGSYFASGFGMEYVPSIGAKIGTVGVNELASVEGIAFPNPATDVVTINIEATGNAVLTVTDIAGRTAMTKNVGLANGTADVNIETLESGVYVFNVAFEDGRTSQFNVVKK
ncbi:MAG: PA domain-containing protein [Crocinitomicaceae bacterium]